MYVKNFLAKIKKKDKSVVMILSKWQVFIMKGLQDTFSLIIEGLIAKRSNMTNRLTQLYNNKYKLS